ncbi:MAG: PQQ-dependent sugar dehydrogenase [Alphaproteobacteria bacterium]|nr:PQQ-dependent sugar dehydrogenase [Alphaproteobacteria bacterium]
MPSFSPSPSPLGKFAWAVAVTVAAAASVAPTAAYAGITDAPRAAKTSLSVETIASGLVNPWGLQFLPDGRMLVTEKPGRIRIISTDGKKSAPVSGLPKVYARGQGGLLDVRLATDFASSGTIFFSYSEPRRGGKAGTTVARAKLVLDGSSGGGRLENVTVIYRQTPAIRSSHHFGSRIVIDNEGMLFVTTGDRGSQSKKAQDPSVPIGKVLRITPDGKPAPGNPTKPGWAPEVWSIGHRNLQGAVLDPATGALWTVEHGARGGDELNQPQAGKNYGWPVISYGRHYSGGKIGVGRKKAGLEQPVYYWDPSIATSGLELYTGDLFAGWKGNLLVGGLAGARLARLILENGKVVAEEKLLTDRGDRIRDVRQGPDGAIYVLTDDRTGDLLRLTPK